MILDRTAPPSLDPAGSPPGSRRRLAWVIGAMAALTGLLGLAAVLAPVEVNDPVVDWPRAGAAPTSTVLPLSPYRPLQLRAEIPCATLAALDGRPGGGEALRTLPADVDAKLGGGLVVAVADGAMSVVSSNTPLFDEPVPSGPCRYTIEADAAGTRVLHDGTVVADAAGLLPPQVAELETGAERLPQAAGLAVELHTDARYESAPSTLKAVLLVGHALAFVAMLVASLCYWRGRGPGLVRPRLSLADAVVAAVTAVWTVLGPMNIDDAWYALMARTATGSGYLGNAIYQFNVTENPFVASQYPMQAWGALTGWSLVALRVLPAFYGLATYAPLRVLLATVLGERLGRRRSVPWALAFAHLLWFLPYGMTLRPEPLIVLGTASVLVLAELARRRESVGVLAAATAVAALTVGVSPTGLVAGAPLLLQLPWLWRWLRARGWSHRLAAGLLAAASATVLVPLGFADASLGDVRESVAVHRWYYRQHPWYDELVHYANLLGPDDQGAWGKRLPVLLTWGVLAVALVAVGRRRGTGGPLDRLLAGSALVTALALASLTLTPTKWVNHFEAVAAPATVLLAAALLRSPLPRRAGRAVSAVGAVIVVGVVAVGYAGPNLWRPFTDWGQPFGNHARLDTPYEVSLTIPGFGPLELHNPLLWAAVAGAAVWWAARRPRSGMTPDRAVLATATGLTVVGMLAVFTLAPLRQYPGPSVASMNLAALAGKPCGLGDAVHVEPDARPGSGTSLVGSARSVPAGELVAGQPVFADQVSAVLWPCVDQIGIRHGIAQTPAYRLRAGDGLEGAIENNSTFAPNGGTLVGIARTARFVELPSALRPTGGVPALPWGHVERVEYDHPVGLVDLRVDRVSRAGWVRLPTLVGDAYTGRSYIG